MSRQRRVRARNQRKNFRTEPVDSAPEPRLSRSAVCHFAL